MVYSGGLWYLRLPRCCTGSRTPPCGGGGGGGVDSIDATEIEADSIAFERNDVTIGPFKSAAARARDGCMHHEVRLRLGVDRDVDRLRRPVGSRGGPKVADILLFDFVIRLEIMVKVETDVAIHTRLTGITGESHQMLVILGLLVQSRRQRMLVDVFAIGVCPSFFIGFSAILTSARASVRRLTWFPEFALLHQYLGSLGVAVK